MKEVWTIEDYRAHILGDKKKPKNNLQRGNKAKAQVGWTLIDLSRRLGLTLVQEYRFNPDRKWRADWALFGKHNGKEVKILIEYEGIFSAKSRHTTVGGYSKDSEKYNSAQALGWIVLRFTYLTYGSLTEELKKHLSYKTI